MIPAQSKLTVMIEGQTRPLHGTEELLQDQLREELNDLLERRGFIIDEEETTFSVKLTYETVTGSDLSEPVGSGDLFFSSSDLIPGKDLGLGVFAAMEFAYVRNQTSLYNRYRYYDSGSYAHVISLEFIDGSGNIVRKSESIWRTDNLDLLTAIKPVLQVMMSSLPSDPSLRIIVPEVKQGREKAFFNLSCRDKWLTCPALPYRITFPFNPTVDGLPGYINNPEALAAYVDLLQTAEYAVPIGRGSTDYNNPMEMFLWTKVMLGGSYKLGISDKPVDVLVVLRGKEEGYIVSDCRIANPDEFKQFKRQMSKWHEALKSYYDYYVSRDSLH